MKAKRVLERARGSMLLPSLFVRLPVEFLVVDCGCSRAE